MELNLTREKLVFERIAAVYEEQVSIQGEAALPGSMRDAVTVLSVQAQSTVTSAQAGTDEIGIRGHVRFQILYTQGDLTRIRSVETVCDFDHRAAVGGVGGQMRLCVSARVLDAEGAAGNGRVSLRALVSLRAEAFQTQDTPVVTDVQGEKEIGLQTRMQEFELCMTRELGEGSTLVREEIDLPDRLGAGDVLSAWAEAASIELTGGNGRVGVSGTIEVQVLHRPLESGQPLVRTTHELPYDLVLDALIAEGTQPLVSAEVMDVMADAAPAERGRLMRVEAQVRVKLSCRSKRQVKALEDLYSLRGDELSPVTQTLDLCAVQEDGQARESLRLQAALPEGAAPLGTMLTAFCVPTLTSLVPDGRRLDAEGLMGITLVYLPVDSDIPCAVRVREPFALTFALEGEDGVYGEIDCMQTSVGPATSDRAELRCVLRLRTHRHLRSQVQAVTEVTQTPEQTREKGFVLVWPAQGETRWETARRLRVPQEELRPAGKNALLAIRR